MLFFRKIRFHFLQGLILTVFNTNPLFILLLLPKISDIHIKEYRQHEESSCNGNGIVHGTCILCL